MTDREMPKVNCPVCGKEVSYNFVECDWECFCHNHRKVLLTLEKFAEIQEDAIEDLKRRGVDEKLLKGLNYE
jgi:hypothetical protein